ncbi:mannitol dehydrogenase family protein [Microbacterium halophytorum]|uniref:mannitol dehydrogenase family protein n=1 Tax=Microbacterium halophytorum TaxID=2067568 RepID=UPI000CFC5A5B|nr:mannitol dehydrogenase family protein [Microbacterium halophytorum]
MSRPLTRAARKPVRLVHIGLGSFFRAHQARLTQLAGDGDDWGYAAFTVRSPHQAEQLTAQDGLYTLTERSATGETVSVVDQVSAAHDGADLAALAMYLADPDVAVVTLTITEGGYAAASHPDVDEVREDASRAAAWASGRASGAPASPLARLVAALDVRRRAEAGALAVVPCDNLPDNGRVAAAALAAYAAALPDTAAWIGQNVSFCSTAVDRITPRIDDAERRALAAASGWDDAAPVATEAYVEWVIEGEFPAGRPDWPSAGVVLTDDVRPYEDRKLRMLNGAHTILAIGGLRRGLATVDEAIAHPELRDLVDAWWIEAGATLPSSLEPVAYADALRVRFANPALSHRLEQIAENTPVKIASRILPVVAERRAAGAGHVAGSRALAEWSLAVREGSIPGPDAADEAARILHIDPTHDPAALERALAEASIAQEEAPC